MPIDVDAAVVALKRMTVNALRDRYAEVFGEPTRSRNKEHLIKRIAWRLQAIREGGLSERARQRAMKLANDADLRLKAPTSASGPDNGDGGERATFAVPAGWRTADARLPMPGTLLKREYKGRMIQVRVLPQGFDFEGQVYRSLSAIAKQVTGSHWNGYGFFGINAHAGQPQKEVTE
jgi:hypothetical protein